MTSWLTSSVSIYSTTFLKSLPKLLVFACFDWCMLCILAASGEHVDLEELVDDFVTFYIAGEPAIQVCMFMIHVHVACNTVLLVLYSTVDTCVYAHSQHVYSTLV